MRSILMKIWHGDYSSPKCGIFKFISSVNTFESIIHLNFILGLLVTLHLDALRKALSGTFLLNLIEFFN